MADFKIEDYDEIDELLDEFREVERLSEEGRRQDSQVSESQTRGKRGKTNKN